MSKKTVLLVVLFWTTTSVAWAAGAHAPWHSGNYWAVGAQLTYPNGDFNKKYSAGHGLQAVLDYPVIPLFDLTGSVGWNHFPHQHQGSGIDIWEFTVGGRFALGAFFMSGESGYFSKLNEWSYVPGIGLRYTHWEASVRIKVAGANTWSGLRLGYFF